LLGPAALSAVICGAIAGAVLLSGSDQPSTAHVSPRWLELPSPPLSDHGDRVGARIGHRVLVIGAGEGAVYDLRTGVWQRVWAPVPASDRDVMVEAAGVGVLRHVRTGRPASWWSYDPRRDIWTRIRHLPPQLSAPSSLGSELYALSGRRVTVYSVQLDRWTRLAADRVRPLLRGVQVTASRAGTVVRGYAGRSRILVADRWDGLTWRRIPSAAPMRVGTRSVAVSRTRAWIRSS
jgi:hypothetical protein